MTIVQSIFRNIRTHPHYIALAAMHKGRYRSVTYQELKRLVLIYSTFVTLFKIPALVFSSLKIVFFLKNCISGIKNCL
jgi:hypothetical protein